MSSFARLLVFLFAASVARQHISAMGQLFEGDTCRFNAKVFGECKKVSSCDSAKKDIQNGKRPEICSYERDEPIVCCLNPNINGSPPSSPGEPHWPSEPGAVRPTQSNTQRPIQGGAQRPIKRPDQRPIQGGSQRPIDRPNQRPITEGSQRPAEGPNQKPILGVPQGPAQGDAQRPNSQGGPQIPIQGGPQRPNQRPIPDPTPLPVMMTQPPTPSKKKPQWLQIPKGKRTESPDDIPLPTTPKSETFSSRDEMKEINQLPNRVQEDVDKEGDRIAEAERVVFKQDRGK